MNMESKTQIKKLEDRIWWINEEIECQRGVREHISDDDSMTVNLEIIGSLEDARTKLNHEFQRLKS